jgi:general secretion pathway protein D
MASGKNEGRMKMNNIIYSILLTAFSTFAMATQTSETNIKATQFGFKDAEIRTVAGVMGQMLRKTFVIDSNVKAKLTILPSGPLTSENAYAIFLQALADEGYTVVEYGTLMRITSGMTAQRTNLETFDNVEIPEDTAEKMITVVKKFKFVSAKDIYNELGPMLQSRMGEMRVFEDANSIIMIDYTSNARRVMKLLKGFDIAENAGHHVKNFEGKK